MKDQERNIPKELTWDILRCCMISYEGADPKAYGFDSELARIGSQLATALHKRVERLIPEFLKEGKLKHKYFGQPHGKLIFYAEDKNEKM